MKFRYRILMNGHGKFFLERRAIHWWHRAFSSEGCKYHAWRVAGGVILEWGFPGESTALFAESTDAIQALIKLQQQDFKEQENERKSEQVSVVVEEIR